MPMLKVQNLHHDITISILSLVLSSLHGWLDKKFFYQSLLTKGQVTREKIINSLRSHCANVNVH